MDSGELIGGATMDAYTPDEMTTLRDAARAFAPLCEVRGVS